MTYQIFISHSAKDRKAVDYFVEKFTDTGVKPVLMEYEKWSREGKPNWKWIYDEIQKSQKLFLILTKNIVKNVYTQNWVAFEVGVASTNNPSIPVFVFREENIDFPVPYLTHYFDEPLSTKDYLFSRDISKTFLNVLINTTFESFVDALVKNPTISLSEDDPIKCSNCLISFQYIGVKEKIRCPCCSTILTNSIPDITL